jgi:hypothetical protein
MQTINLTRNWSPLSNSTSLKPSGQGLSLRHTDQLSPRRFVVHLPSAGRLSAGIYDSAGTLVRTLVSAQKLESAGEYPIFWDGLSDEGVLLPSGNYSLSALYNNIQYTWDGILCNTSRDQTSDTVHRPLDSICGMCIVGTEATYISGYTEGSQHIDGFSTQLPQVRVSRSLKDGSSLQTSNFIASDGKKRYFAGLDPNEVASQRVHFVFATNCADLVQSTFSHGTPITFKQGAYYPSGIAASTGADQLITGICVQTLGNYLFVSRSAANLLQVLDKTTGELLHTVSVQSAGVLACNETQLWLSNGTSITTDGNITLTALNIPTQSAAVGISLRQQALLVALGGTTQQVKAYNTTTGAQLWSLGSLGGNMTTPKVTLTTFLFAISDPDSGLAGLNPRGSVCWDSDGSFWVIDSGNYRVLHFAANLNYIEQIATLGRTYAVHSIAGATHRVLAAALEFLIDHTKPVKQAWTLTRNWSAFLPTEYDRSTPYDLTVLQNGRVFGLIRKGSLVEIIELLDDRIRFTGFTWVVNWQHLYPDGSLRSHTDLPPYTYTVKSLIQLPIEGPPIYSEAVVVESNTPSLLDPIPSGDGNQMPYSQTLNGCTIVYNAGLSNTDGTPPRKFRLGGMRNGKFVWRTARETLLMPRQATYPSDGSFDISNNPRQPNNDPVGYGGTKQCVWGRHIIWTFRGEFWKNSQTNYFTHVYENGLMLGLFGTDGVVSAGLVAPAGMAGNALTPHIVETSDNTFLLHGDESAHGGIHRWRIDNLKSIRLFSIPFTQ